MIDRIRNGDVEPIQTMIYQGGGSPLTGLTDIFVRVQRNSDKWFLDWSDATFKAIPTTKDQLLSEVDATDLPGIYELAGGFDTSTLTNAVVDDTYTFYVLQTPGTTAILPAPAQLQVGGWVGGIGDQVDKIDKAATLTPGTTETGSLLDRLANKDGSKTYDQGTDALEALKDRIG